MSRGNIYKINRHVIIQYISNEKDGEMSRDNAILVHVTEEEEMIAESVKRNEITRKGPDPGHGPDAGKWKKRRSVPIDGKRRQRRRRRRRAWRRGDEIGGKVGGGRNNSRHVFRRRGEERK